MTNSTDPRRAPIRPDRVRVIAEQFSWVDRDLLHRGFLDELSRDEIALYFFLTLVAGPQGTSFWSHGRIAEWLKLSLDDHLRALRGLIKKDLVAFKYPTFRCSPCLRGERDEDRTPGSAARDLTRAFQYLCGRYDPRL